MYILSQNQVASYIHIRPRGNQNMQYLHLVRACNKISTHFKKKGHPYGWPRL